MANQIDCNVFVKRDALKNPISYVQGTDLLPIVLHFLDFEIPAGATANVFVLKPDKTAFYSSATISGNDVTIDVDKQMFVVTGFNILQVEITSGGETLVNFAQPVTVKPNYKTGDYPESETKVEWIDEAIKQAQEAVDDANTAVENANTAIDGANQAAQNANNAAKELEQKAAAGDFDGPKGDPGDAATVQIGTVQTLQPGENATVNNSGTENAAVLNFGIPQGPQGEEGTAATVEVGSVTTLPAGSDATVENVGTENAAILNFGIPQGPAGNLESFIANYYALRRTGKVYQTKIWKFATNPTPTGEKLLDNAGLVFEPSTDTAEGQDDYLNGQHPLFEWVHVNYVRDEDGSPRPIAIEGDSNYKDSGAVDVGAMQMSFWWKWDASNAEYDLITISDTPHPELGLIPWCESVKADGTVLPWCIGSAYVSGTASDGKLRSQPGLKPARNQSHNNMITNYSKKGEGYKGAGAERNTFQFIFDAIKGATKNSQSLFAGVTNWNIQYEASIQSVDNHTYFPVTNAQAENIPLGTCVSVGYGGNKSGTANNDRGQATIHEYADDVKVLRKEALPDGENTAIYLDIPDDAAFNTMPHVYDDTFSAPIILSSMHAVAGLTDSVIGHHDGSPVSNTDSKRPYRVQGREYLVGGYIVASDTVAWLNADGTRTVYVAEKGTVHSSSNEVIKDTYKVVGTIPVGSGGVGSDWYIGDDSVDSDTGAWWPSAEGSGSTQGVCDRYYAGGDASDTFREYLMGGSLWNGSHAGGSCLALGYSLGNESWYYLACD